MRELWRSKGSNGAPARFQITSLYTLIRYTKCDMPDGYATLATAGNAHHKRVFRLEFGNCAL